MQFFLIGRHIALGTTIYKTYVLYTGHALCRTSHVHGGIAGTDNDHISAKINGLRCTLELFKELKGIQSLAGLQRLAARRPRTNSYHHIGIALSKQGVYVFDFNSGIERCTVCLTKFDVVINGFLRDTETWDDMANNTTEFIGTFKNNYFNTCA